MIDLSRCPITPYAHQVIGIQRLVDQPYFLLADEMGAGKTLQVIVAAQVLFTQGLIDRVIVVTPAAVRRVWADSELGELKKHLWDGLPALVTEYHAKNRQWQSGLFEGKNAAMKWVITNYDFLVSQERLEYLFPLVTKKTMLVLDESSAVKNPQAARTKACMKLRKLAGRVILLNGTPIANHPGDMFSQGNLMNPGILGCYSATRRTPSFVAFKSRYAIMGGWQQKQIVKWQNLDDLQRRFAPYVLRRLKIDCLDLPAKLPPAVITATLTEETWARYKEMRDDLITWLSNSSASMAPQAITKVMRLDQITSGFLGGVEETQRHDPTMKFAESAELLTIQDRAGTLVYSRDEIPLPFEQCISCLGTGYLTHRDDDWPCSCPLGNRHAKVIGPVREIGREKLDVFLSWLADRLYEDQNFKLISFSRFRPELERMHREAKKIYPQIPMGLLVGSQKRDNREASLRLLDPRTAPSGPAFVFGNQQTGGLGLNLSAAHCMFRSSNDYSHFRRAQSDDRIHRPGQVHPCSYTDLVAVGPKGQKTINHVILSALQKKEDLATMTMSAWVRALEEE